MPESDRYSPTDFADTISRRERQWAENAKDGQKIRAAGRLGNKSKRNEYNNLDKRKHREL